jgi:hypothetical protein
MADNVLAKEQMVLGPEALNCGIQKRLVHAGKAPIEYVDGTKVCFFLTKNQTSFQISTTKHKTLYILKF